jgi:Mrp family chromosome partitioning ATPase
VVRRDAAIDRLRDQLAVVPLVGTDALEVRVIDTDPHLAQRVANQVVHTFFASTVNSSQEQARRRRQFLAEQLQETERLLARAQGGLSAFRSRRQLSSSSAKLAQQQAELMSLDSRRGELQSDRKVFRSLLTRVQTANDSARADELRTLAYSPEIGADPIVGKVLQQILTYRTRIDSITSGPWQSSATNPDVLQLKQLMRTSQEELVRGINARLRSLDERLAALSDLRNTSADNIASLPALEAEEARLDQKVVALSDFANQLRLEFQKARMSEELAAADIEIVDLASLPYLPTGIPWWLKLGVALMVALAMGAGMAVMLEIRNRSIRGPEELRRVLPELGVIPPVAEAVAAVNALAAGKQRFSPGTARVPLQGVVLDAPWPSVGAEAFRLLYSSLTFNWGEGRRIIMITSVAPQEGKTLVAANLAVTFAREGAHVLLVDCDLRRPRLHKMFQVARSPGLIQLLRPASAPVLPEDADGHDEARPSARSYSMLPGVDRLAGDNGNMPSGTPSPNRVRAGDAAGLSRNGVSLPSVRETSVKGLFVLPSGTIPQNSSETLKAGPFRRLLDEIAEGYDVVVLDTPPVLVSADAVILAPLADDVLLVVRAGQTHREAVERAHQQLTDAGAHVLGAVLNDPEGEVGRDHKTYYEYNYPAGAD